MEACAGSKTTSGVNNGVIQTGYEPKTSQHGLDAESPSCLVVLMFFYDIHVAKSQGLNKCIECHACASYVLEELQQPIYGFNCVCTGGGVHPVISSSSAICTV